MRHRLLDHTDALLVAWTLGVKVAVLAIGVLALWAVNGSIPPLLEPWHRWDAPHYTDVAIWGYRASDPGNLTYPGYAQDFPGDLGLYIVFFPLFPWLTSAVLAVVRDPVVAAFIVSTVASLFVAPMLYRLVSADLGPSVGIKAAAFLLVFPTAYFLHIGYTESLFLALVLGSFLAARSSRCVTAGLLGGLSALTRVNGLLMIPSLAAEAWTEWRVTRQLRLAWAWIGLVAVGFGGYLLLNLLVYGDPFAFVQIQNEHWFKSLAMPWVGIGGVVDRLGDPNLENVAVLGVAELVAIGLGLAGTLYSLFRFRASWTVWMAGSWLLFVSTAFVLSVPRYAIAMFPLFAWFAVLAERRWLGITIGAVSVGLLLWFSGRFALGSWAF
jgi:hypothetical protein